MKDIIISTDRCSMAFSVAHLKTLNLNDRIEYGKSVYKHIIKQDVVPDNVIAAFGEAFAKVDEMQVEPTSTTVIIEYPTASEDTNLPTEETPTDVETSTDVETPIEETPTEETPTEETPTEETPTEETSTDVEVSTDTGTGEEEPTKTE